MRSPATACLAAVTLAALCGIIPSTGCSDGDAKQTPQSPATEVVVGSESHATNADGSLPCDWVQTKGGGQASLVFGLSASGRIAGLGLVVGGEDCAVDRHATARVLVLLALGEALTTPAEREAAWATTQAADLNAIVEILSLHPDLEALWNDALNFSKLQAAVREAALPLATPPKPLSLGFTPDQNGTEGLEFDAPALSSDGGTLLLTVTAPGTVHEIKAIMVGDQPVAFLKGSDTLDPLGPLFSGFATDSATVEIPVSLVSATTLETPIHVVAPAVFTRIVDWNAETPLTLNEELAYGYVTQRSLAGYAMNAVLTVAPDIFAKWAQGGQCAKDLNSLLASLATEVVGEIEAGNDPAGAVAGMLQSMWLDGLPALESCNLGTSTWLGKLSEFLSKFASGWDLLSQSWSLMSEVGGGQAILHHSLNSCAACVDPPDDNAAIPACSVVLGKLRCPTCTDGTKNQGETGVDCGGPCVSCNPTPTCTDGIKNQGETGVDCGGPCAACAPAPTCSDGVKNQAEQGVDCGGPCPKPCCPSGNGLYCGTGGSQDPSYLYLCQNGNYSMASDCAGLGCIQNPPGMDDACVSCGDGQCSSGEDSMTCCTDCACSVGSSCVGGSCVLDPTCTDGVQNQGESGVDCGGPCLPCETCNDGIQNQGEPNVDCGGPCQACTCPGSPTQKCQNCGTEAHTCQPDGIWGPWGACLDQDNCPAGQACDHNINTCVFCGDVTQACCAGNVCANTSSLVCYGGSCAICGTVGDPCCDSSTVGVNGQLCDSSTICTGGLCQPHGVSTPTTVYYEDFENVVWDHVGQGTLPNHFDVWDFDSTIHTSLGSGYTGLEAFVWHGAGELPVAPASAATMTLPPALDGSTNVEFSFDGLASSQFDITVGRVGCTTQTVTIPSAGWAHKILQLPACGATSRIVLQVGPIRNAPTNLAALSIDNLRIRYVYPEVCDGADNDGDAQVDEGNVCPGCADQCTLGTWGCQASSTELDCIAPTMAIPCNHYGNPHQCSSGSGCFDGPGCQPCGGVHEQCCPGGQCKSGKSCWQNVCEYLVNGCVDHDGDGYGSIVCGGTDCDDTTSLIRPTAVESCNGVDDNCNGQIDEGCP